MKIVDLSHTMSIHTPGWVGYAGNKMYYAQNLQTQGIVAQRIETSLHAGTHFDGAMHATDGRTGDMASLPLDFLVNQGVVIDLPRTIYPLQRSPRLFAFLDRHREVRGAAERAFNQRYRQLGERLLDRVEQAIRYQMRQDAQRVRSRILHFSTIADTPGLVSRLLSGASQ